MAPAEDVWITGVGATSAFGEGVEVLWRSLLAGDHAIRAVSLFDVSRHRTRLAAQAEASVVARREGRTDALARAAVREAIADAGDLSGAGVFWGTSTGGMFEGEQFYWRETSAKRGRVPVAPLACQPPGAPACTVARAIGTSGPVETIATACAASTMALEAALIALRGGEVDVALAGGSDGLCELTFGGFNSLRAVSESPARPFRPMREGLSIGEGAGALLLERAEHARARGARPLALLTAARSTCDSFHMTAPHPEGRGMAAAARGALEEAGVPAGDLALVNAHGTGTPHNDGAEWLALESALEGAASSTPVTATKGAVGHLLGACGALEAVVCVRALQEGVVPPTPGEGPVDPEAPVDLVLGEPRRLKGATALSQNLAFGGANAAIVIAGAPR